MSNFKVFENIGGKFLISHKEFQSKLQGIKAFIFDWDGVFTDGGKDHEQQSRFNEADSMGTNLLRFSFFLQHKKLPLVSILSGENNRAAFNFVAREYFDLKYFKVPDKIKAFDHICKTKNLKPEEILYVFDDVLDLSVAEQCGLRIFVPRNATPLLNNYIVQNKLADYVTGCPSGQCPVREASELLIDSYGLYNDVIRHRKEFSDTYKKFVELKKAGTTAHFTMDGGEITPYDLQKL